MSNLVVSNISDGTTSVGTGYVVNGSAKAWASAITSTAPATLSGSLNISSFTDNATGDFTFSFSTAMADTTYSVLTGCGGGILVSLIVPTTKVVGSQNLIGANPSGSNVDGSHVYFAVTGDLA